MNNVGHVLREQGDFRGAREHYERCLVMRQALYPKEKYPQGHVDLGISLGNLGSLSLLEGDYPQGLALIRQALATYEALFPKGSIQFDCALLMRGIEHEWRGQADLCCAMGGPAHESPTAPSMKITTSGMLRSLRKRVVDTENFPRGVRASLRGRVREKARWRQRAGPAGGGGGMPGGGGGGAPDAGVALGGAGGGGGGAAV